MRSLTTRSVLDGIERRLHYGKNILHSKCGREPTSDGGLEWRALRRRRLSGERRSFPLESQSGLSHLCRMDSDLKYIDIFAGCGGLSTGLYLAGWAGLFAIESNAAAFSTLKLRGQSGWN